MTKIAARDLPTYYDAEERSRKLVDDQALLFGKDAKGTLHDKLRLLYVKALETDVDPDAFRSALQEAHPEQGAFVDRAFAALKEAKTRRVRLSAAAANNPALRADAEAPSFAQLLSKGATKLVDKAASVGNLLLAAKSSFACRVLQDVVELKGTFHDDFDLVFDPTKPTAGTAVLTAIKDPPSDVLVFVVGGGCYAEYHALQAAFPNRSVVYGATHLASPDAFLDDLIANLTTTKTTTNPAAAAASSSSE
mmetsp:Transcript_26625/g.86191  ORF Transcript_26625/g.86191 Transcript_26625/m.86191 type:complete len:250 (+) Transcript_26625:1759-2508(+)